MVAYLILIWKQQIKLQIEICQFDLKEKKMPKCQKTKWKKDNFVSPSECAIPLFKMLSSGFLRLNLLSSFSYSIFPSPNSIYHRHGQKALFMENLHSLHTHLWYMQNIWPWANRSEGTFQPPSFTQSSLHFVPNFSDRVNHSTQKKPTEAQWEYSLYWKMMKNGGRGLMWTLLATGAYKSDDDPAFDYQY